MKRHIIWFLMIIILITGCSKPNVYLDKERARTEEEIISFIEQTIYSQNEDNVIVTLKSKEDLRVCTSSFLDASCIRYSKVLNGYVYTFDIVNSLNKDIVATATYKDPYIIDGKKVREYFNDNYKEQKALYNIKYQFELTLKKYSNNYYIYNDIGHNAGYDIFINSTNYTELKNIITELDNTISYYRNGIYTSYSIYIFKSEVEFKNINFDKYNEATQNFGGQSYAGDILPQITGLTAKRIAGQKGFSEELFNSNGELGSKNILHSNGISDVDLSA